MPAPKSEAPMSRMSIYITEPNSRRLAAIPRGQKTELVNEALDKVLSDIEKRKNFHEFIDEISKIKRVKVERSISDMIKELREPRKAQR